MDTLTHIVLGACIGEAIAGKQLGKKALLLGAIAQNIPDVDFVASFWLPISTDLLAHRGFTHSIAFTIIVAPLLAWMSVSLFRKAAMPFSRWVFFWGLQIFIHIFIDAFNAYGTGWFEPFSHYRVSFNTIFVADPLFFIWPAIAFIALLFLRRNNTKRMAFTKAALWLSSIYLLSGIIFKLVVNNKVEKQFATKRIAAGRFFTTPTPLNDLLWYIVAETDSGYYIGYRSVLDKQDNIDFHFAFKNDTLLKLAANRNDVNNLVRFSNGYYAAQMWQDTLVFNDLRFGEILGWVDPKPKFIFYYFLQNPGDNKMIVQRGRFARWDKEAVMAFIKRIKGI